MNLARVEYYLAEVLSAMESAQPMYLDRQSDASLPSEVQWPTNVYLFGTVNIDESTLPISDKVLDRGNVVNTDDFDLAPFLDKCLAGATNLTSEAKEQTRAILLKVWTVLRVVNGHFGFRTAKAMVDFVDAASAGAGAGFPVDAALDFQVLQRVLPKLRGDQRWGDVLGKLAVLVEPYPRSQKAIERMQSDLEQLGTFQFWS